jgi:hypothetical protein
MELGHSSFPRRKSKRVMVGDVAVGDGAPLSAGDIAIFSKWILDGAQP